jgi:hypothetical protein
LALTPGIIVVARDWLWYVLGATKGGIMSPRFIVLATVALGCLASAGRAAVSIHFDPTDSPHTYEAL